MGRNTISTFPIFPQVENAFPTVAFVKINSAHSPTENRHSSTLRHSPPQRVCGGLMMSQTCAVGLMNSPRCCGVDHLQTREESRAPVPRGSLPQLSRNHMHRAAVCGAQFVWIVCPL